MSAREIEVVKLSVSEAHRRFAGCKVDSSNVGQFLNDTQTLFA